MFFLNFQQIYDIKPYVTNTFNYFLIIFAIIDKIHNMQFSIVPKIDAEIMFSEDACPFSDDRQTVCIICSIPIRLWK